MKKPRCLVVNRMLTSRFSFAQIKAAVALLAPLAKLAPSLESRIRLSDAVSKAKNIRAAAMGQSDREKLVESPGPPFHYLPDLLEFVNDNGRWAQAFDAVMEALTVSRVVNLLLNKLLTYVYLFRALQTPSVSPSALNASGLPPKQTTSWTFLSQCNVHCR